MAHTCEEKRVRTSGCKTNTLRSGGAISQVDKGVHRNSQREHIALEPDLQLQGRYDEVAKVGSQHARVGNLGTNGRGEFLFEVATFQGVCRY